MKPPIAVLDYGIGNIRSAEKALQHVGANARLVTEPQAARRAAAIVLPGVGAFAACAAALSSTGLGEVVLDAVAASKPVLCVCVGLQLLFEGSEESPGAAGLAVFGGLVKRLPDGLKRPQMQWNRVDPVLGSKSSHGENIFGTKSEWFYFVHGYSAYPDDPSLVVATCEYGGPVTAVVAHENVFATQFHPEKSGRAGLDLLHRFARQCEG
jgi:glutamine amidotransferase